VLGRRGTKHPDGRYGKCCARRWRDSREPALNSPAILHNNTVGLSVIRNGGPGTVQRQGTWAQKPSVLPARHERAPERAGVLIDGYLDAVEHTVQAGAVSEAVTLAAALPEICSALELPNLRSSPARYIGWCEAWLEERGVPDAEEPLTGMFLYRLHTAGMIPRQLGCATREEFEQFVCLALIKAARRWYRQCCADELT